MSTSIQHQAREPSGTNKTDDPVNVPADNDDGDQERQSSNTPVAAHLKPETPLPKLSLAIIFLVRVCEPVNFTFLFPFINQYIWDLGVTKDKSQVGIYAGMIESLFAIAQVCTVLHWSSLSDRIGRRPVLIIGTSGVMLSSALFGFAKTFPMAVFARALTGVLNGNVAILRSVVGELTDDTNAPRAFVLLPLAWNVGAAVGPFLGGFFVFPARQFPKLFGNKDAPFYFNAFWVKNPYALPCLFVSCLSLLGLVVMVFFLPETLASKVQEIERKKAERKAAKQTLGSGPDEEQTPLLHSSRRIVANGGPTTTSNGALVPTASARIASDSTAGQVGPAPRSPSESSSPWSMLRIPHVRSVIMSFAVMTFVGAGFEAVLVLFMYEPIQLGGLYFTSPQTGTYLGSFSVVAILVQTSLTPFLIRRFGNNNVYFWALLCFPIMASLLPVAWAVAKFGGQGHAGGEDDPLPQHIQVIIWIISALNGLSTMASAFARACGPSFYTFLFSVTVNPSVPFFRGWLVWAVLIVSGIAASWSTTWIKPIAVAVQQEEARQERLRQRELQQRAEARN
ncbi:hypothetical protein OC845_001738 [Tilletia horrida]|nr:hypothetical protein OC845_001738 [Tilletia horrida]